MSATNSPTTQAPNTTPQNQQATPNQDLGSAPFTQPDPIQPQQSPLLQKDTTPKSSQLAPPTGPKKKTSASPTKNKAPTSKKAPINKKKAPSSTTTTKKKKAASSSTKKKATPVKPSKEAPEGFPGEHPTSSSHEAPQHTTKEKTPNLEEGTLVTSGAPIPTGNVGMGSKGINQQEVEVKTLQALKKKCMWFGGPCFFYFHGTLAEAPVSSFSMPQMRRQPS